MFYITERRDGLDPSKSNAITAQAMKRASGVFDLRSQDRPEIVQTSRDLRGLRKRQARLNTGWYLDGFITACGR